MKRTIEPLQLTEDEIITRICHVRSVKALLDYDLADMYGIPVKQLRQTVLKTEWFPEDYIFMLTPLEQQHGRRPPEKKKRGAPSKWPPMAFTESGIGLLCTIFRDEICIKANLAILRTLCRLREMYPGDAYVMRLLEDMKQKYETQVGLTQKMENYMELMYQELEAIRGRLRVLEAHNGVIYEEEEMKARLD